MPPEIKRLFTLPDEEMQTRAKTMKDLLNDDLADFTAKFPWIDAGYVTSFGTTIITAKSFPLDDTVINDIKVLTEDLGSSMKTGMRALDELDIYAQLTYPDSPAKQRVFGQDNWQKARNDQEKMVNALELAHSFANAAPYKAALIAKGLTQALIDSLDSISIDIDTKNGLQEKAKASRPVSTQDRIAVNNAVWRTMKTVAICAQLVYRDNAAKLAEYRLYPSGSSVNTTVIVRVRHSGFLVEGALTGLDNTDLVKKLTEANGEAVFESVNMPDTVDVSSEKTGVGSVTSPNHAVLIGDSTTIDVELV